MVSFWLGPPVSPACYAPGYCFRLTARGHLYAPSHTRLLLHQSWSTGETWSSSLNIASGIDPTTHRTMSRRSNSVRERKVENVLFNDALSTFLLTVIWRRTYETGPFHGILFPVVVVFCILFVSLLLLGCFCFCVCMQYPSDRIAHTTTFVYEAMPGKRNIAQWGIDPTTPSH